MITLKNILKYKLKRNYQRLRVFRDLINIYNNKKIIYFVSFPKSGRTWVRYFLNYYFFICNPLSVTSRNDMSYYKNIPIIIYKHGKYKNLNVTKIKNDIQCMKNKQVIFMIRDPRDTFISYYFQLTKRYDPAKRIYKAFD
ncbi:MAG: sulfotransferase domain-containing protein, partial [Desulfotignum sp.]|nr:sulfotransferase domain-containing protein [Desulfotignum sp.]